MSETTPKVGEGLRFNEGKLRYDLIHPAAEKGLVQVLTKGSIKYAPRNWEKGMLWSNIISSLKRHLAAFEGGEDFDPETGELHADHIQCNAHFLAAYYRIFPQGDDRAHVSRKAPRIGLDIDDVICSWVGPWTEFHGQLIPTAWNFDWNLTEKFKSMSEAHMVGQASSDLDIFYSNLPVKTAPEDIPFIPECYITHRPVGKAVTEAWLDKHGFPLKPVFQVSSREEKLKVAQDMKLDIFVDDNFDTYQMMNQNGICCFLFDAVHNRRHDVGFKRIKSLNQILA
jgi:uncharacterized HAD superfamily protein